MLSCRHQHEEEYKKSYNYNLNGLQNLNFTHFKFHKIYFLYFELLQIREVSIDLIPAQISHFRAIDSICKCEC